MKLSTLAGNHQFHYLTGKHKMFDVTVTAKFLTHAKIKIYRTVANAFLNVCEKIRRFLSRIKNVQKRKLVPFFCLTVYNKAMVHCKLRPRRPAPLARLTL